MFVEQVHINTFVTRQTPESSFSCFMGTDTELLVAVLAGIDKAVLGYRDGVLIVPVAPEGFLSAVVTLQDGDKLAGEFKARRAGEAPRQHVGLAVPEENRVAHKSPALKVDVILYASSVLAEDGGSNELPPVDGNWEIISINASMCEGDEPIAPMTLLHNHFGSSGGTATNMTPEQLEDALRVSFDFWKNKTMLA